MGVRMTRSSTFVPRPGLRQNELCGSTRMSPSKTRTSWYPLGFLRRILPSCSGGLQSIRPDDLTPCWLDVTAPALACAGPRGRVTEVMQRGKTLHPPLLSLPSRTESFLDAPHSPAIDLAGLAGARCAPARCHHRGVSVASSSAETVYAIDVMLLAFLEFSGPSTFHCSRSDSRSSKALALLSRTLGLPPQLRGALGFSHPLGASFRNLPSGLVSCRYRPWASTLRRFPPQP
jgi:hypothetical protein